MKVLHVIATLRIAGAEALVINILKNMNRKLFDVRLCVLYPAYNTKLERELYEEQIPVYYLGKHRGIDLQIPGRINWILRHFKPDVIHTHGYILGYPLIPALLNRVPILIHTLHTLAQEEIGFVGKIIHWTAFHLFNVFPISVSRCVAESVKRVYGMNSYVIHNGIQTGQFKTVTMSIKKEQRETTFINISGFRPVKNHRLLINAFTAAIEIKTNLKLWLVGDGPLRSCIEKLVHERNLHDNILFLGQRDDVAELLSNSDVYVSSSEWEGFGLSIVEAMAAGKPIIATKVGAVPELVYDKINGLLVENKDVKALTSAILQLADNPTLIKKMGKENRIRACKRFDIVNTAKKYEELYLKLHQKNLNKKDLAL